MTVSTLALRALCAAQARLARTDDEGGQTLAEYSLIISAIAVAVVIIAVIAFRVALIGTWNSVTDCLNGNTC